jgi:calcineurin-like phosphoesterase family protein
MRVWPRSHYNSWQLYGHSHGRLEPVGKQWDVGVDNNNFYPVSFDQLVEIMKNRPDNFNLVKK